MKSTWIASCIILSFIQPTKSFTPTIPPRFDDVIEHLVGTWSNPKTGNEYGTVEEVMRSCGGAIQGMREVPISPPDRSETQVESFRPYHNRADDGFIFFDCGSYTQGPFHSTTNVNDDDKCFIATLVFQSIPKRRMLIQTNPNVLMTVYMNMMRKKMDPSEKRIKQVVDDSDGNDLSRRNISLAWNNHIVCQMPTEGQAWMLNRAKWFKFEHISGRQPVDVSLELENTPFNGDSDIHEMMGWTESIVHKDVDDINGNHRLSSLLDFNHLKEVILPYSYIIQMGAYCNETKEVKALLRVYDDQNQLKSVILQHGVVCDSL
jgi:hypothetical protein